MFNENSPLWVVHIGHSGDIERRAIEDGFVCIGWGRLGDPNQFADRESMKAAMASSWPEWSAGSVRAMYGQVYRFTHEMQIGDAIVLPVKHSRTIAIGQITGSCIHKRDFGKDEDYDYSNFRTFKWIKSVPRTSFSQGALHSFGSFTTVSTSNDYLEELLSILESEREPLSIETSPITHEGTAHSFTSVESNSAESVIDLFDAALQETEDYLLKAWVRTGTDFEHVVAGVLEAIGYTAKVTQASGDHGVDVIAHPDPLGLQPPFIKVQVKSGTSSIGEPAVSQLIGTLSEGEKGILVSLGGFTREAESRVRHSSKISLIGPSDFVELFLNHYERLDPKWRSRFPLRMVYVPTK